MPRKKSPGATLKFSGFTFVDEHSFFDKIILTDDDPLTGEVHDFIH